VGRRMQVLPSFRVTFLSGNLMFFPPLFGCSYCTTEAKIREGFLP